MNLNKNSPYKELSALKKDAESAGLTLLAKKLDEIAKEVKKLEHHRDTTVGLIATDKPGLIIDQSNYNEIFQEITYE
jgi:hypothetical protein